MQILLTNDDGIRAPGIEAMHDALMDVDGQFGGPLLDGVVAIAPETVQSATSHGVTFCEPLMVKEVKVSEHMSGVAVDGRPADCVKLAICSLWSDRFGEGTRPSLLISGINAGANCGVNVIYSGTVGAAIEGAFLGVPSIAVSLHIGKGRPLFQTAARYARQLIERILETGPLKPHECLNINIPVTETDGPMPPIKVCPMNTHGLVDQYERRVSPYGDVYYWASGHGLEFRATDAQTDVAELLNGCITITPLWYDLTRYDSLERWRAGLTTGAEK